MSSAIVKSIDEKIDALYLQYKEVLKNAKGQDAYEYDEVFKALLIRMRKLARLRLGCDSEEQGV